MVREVNEISDNPLQYKNNLPKFRKHGHVNKQDVKSLTSLTSFTGSITPQAKSVLDVEVSCWQNYQSVNNPTTINLMTWLMSDKHASTVESLRRIEDKGERDRLKATLPAITPSGVFRTRRENGLIAYSGMMQFDIDMKDHMHIVNFSDMKSEIAKIRNVAYCGLSASGRGFWGLVPIRFPDKHKSHFRTLRKQLAQYGINIDSAPQNVASLRGYSYDPHGYFNHFATTFILLDEAVPIPKKPIRKVLRQNHDFKCNGSAVENVIDQIQSQRIDITAGYESWLRIGFALAEEFGENGRDYFHAVSQFHPNYSEVETDRQFTKCLRAKGQGVTIASFFYLCKEYGISVRLNPSVEASRKRV